MIDGYNLDLILKRKRKNLMSRITAVATSTSTTITTIASSSAATDTTPSTMTVINKIPTKRIGTTNSPHPINGKTNMQTYTHAQFNCTLDI